MSKAQEDVLSIRHQLEKMTEDGEQGQALDLLQRLGEIDMNLGILTNTRIGMTVNALRKSSSDDEVISKSKGLIKAWKKFVPPTDTDKKEKSSSQETNGKNNSNSEKNSSTDKKSDEKTFEVKKASATGDEIRLSCRKLLATALQGKSFFIMIIANRFSILFVTETTRYCVKVDSKRRARQIPYK